MDAYEVEYAKTKAFYNLLVDKLGAKVWAKRRAAFVNRIRAKESTIDLTMPIESQLFVPLEDDINWYILVAELAYDSPYRDCAYSSDRIYPYAKAIGAFADLLRKIPNVNGVLNKMLANNTKPETQIFELVTASFYLRNGYEVTFIPENSLVWQDGKTKKSPDLLVKIDGEEIYVECKRADKQTKYSQIEEESWISMRYRMSVAHVILRDSPKMGLLRYLQINRGSSIFGTRRLRGSISKRCAGLKTSIAFQRLTLPAHW